MEKTLSFRANHLDLDRIKELKKFYSEAWNITEDSISVSDIIRWSIGMLHTVKVEQNFRWVSLDDLENGKWGLEKPTEVQEPLKTQK